MDSTQDMTRIGNIHNFYGGLHVRERDGKYYWCIESYDGWEWETIPKPLYDALADLCLSKYDDTCHTDLIEFEDDWHKGEDRSHALPQ